MDTQQALPALEATSSPFGVILSWRWPEGARQGDRVEVQHLAAGAVLCRSKFIEWPGSHTIIGGLAAGQKVQVRARLVDKSGKSNDWKASDWIDGQATDNAAGILAYLNGALVGGGYTFSRSGCAFFNDGESAVASENVPVTKLDEKVPYFSGEVKAATIGDAIKSEQYATLTSGDTIQQRTLSAVLANTLHNVPHNRVGDIAVTLARAVNAAFDQLVTTDASAS
ncbi:hypothetical protein [Atlantibacter hermannii]|uniref:hypothetical protein n=1 Tax=Atlantibacter hermannii TaxID=565 RepID=UPI00289CBC38|nr:hypothetical protein [Atlantibacter hermannii]